MPTLAPSLSVPPRRVSPRDRARLLAVALLIAAVVAGALGSAVRSVGTATPFVLVDPFGAYSTVTLVGWPAPSAPLVFPARVLRVDDVPVGGSISYRDTPASRLRALLDARLSSGHSRATLLFDNGHAVHLDAPLGRVTERHIAPLVALYLAMALCMAAAGIVVAVLAGHTPGGRAYVFLSAVGFLFLATFIDYHTAAWFTPLFLLAYGGNVLGIGWLAWAFPRPPDVRPALRNLARAVAGLVVAVTLWAVTAPLLGVDPVGARVLLSLGISLSLVTLAVSTVARWRSAVGRDREMIRSALGGLALVPAIIGTGMLMTLLATPRVIQAFIPLGGFFIPLSVGYALVRHNAFDTREVLTRRLLVAPMLLLALTAASLAWVVLGAAPPAVSRVLAPATGFALLAGAAYVALRAGANRYVFHSARIFQPTVEGLSDRFARLRDPLEVLAAIEGMARQCISVGDAVVVTPEKLNRADREGLSALHRGERVWVGDSHEEMRLLVPMRSLGELRSVLLVRPRVSGAVLSSEDVSLLDTIASLGAVAMHHSEVIAELQSLRRLERGATRQEKQSTVATFAAELAHEVIVPLAFLREVLEGGQKGVALDADHLKDAQEQVERLERLSLAARRMQFNQLRRMPTVLRDVVRSTVTLLHPSLDEMKVRCELDCDEGLVFAADPDALLQVLSNLLRTGAQAAEGGSIGLRAARADGGAFIEVWDSGPGIDPSIAGDLFRPFVSTRKAGTGIGLVVCARILREFNWTIDHRREEGRTVFRVDVPSDDVLEGPNARD